MAPLATERATGADLWRLGKGGRWRSVEWLRWVRGLRCCCGLSDCPNCGGWAGHGESVVAAHWRYGAAVGAGIKPDDFMAYPLAWSVHHRFHGGGQPSHDTQRAWVLSVWHRAIRAGVLEPQNNSVLRWLAQPPEARTDEIVVAVREAFASGALVLRHPFYATIPF